MSNSYRENENGFFVKVTLFKDDINKYNWRVPFVEETFKQLSKSLGKIPYIDLQGKTNDEHKQYETNKHIELLQSQGIDDSDLVTQIWDDFNKPEAGMKGYLVDMYDVSKKASYGGLLNTCELSAELVKDSEPEVAIADFILRIDDKEYQQKIRTGEVKITPSPSIYGTAKTIGDVLVYDPTQYLDFLHVANATIPANGPHAKTKAICEGSQSSCKKQMANAALPLTDSINNTVTQDNTRMSSTELSNTPDNANQTEQPQTEVQSQQGLTGEEVLKIFEQYNLPKEVITAVDKMNTSLVTLSEKVEKSEKQLQEFQQREEQRALEQRKSLILKHVDLQKHFKGDSEKFKAKAEWINKMFPEQEDLQTYLNEAFPIQEAKKEDNPQKTQAYAGMLFKAEDLIDQSSVPKQSQENKKKQTGWGNLVPL
ncbi:MAG: hypothetical protein R2685_10830 [Candidatus Nitrosocosmicus sp.]|nr:hypothetical protein [Candidatus Nitrosocosmicus sp.]